MQSCRFCTAPKYAFVKIKALNIDSKVISKVPAKFATHYKLIPILLEDNAISLAVTDPLMSIPLTILSCF